MNNFTQKKILITGGAGFIGHNLLAKLINTGCSIRATYNKKEPFHRFDGVEYVKANLLNPSDCNLICSNIDYIIMCAAVTSGASVIENSPFDHLTPNIIMNAQMLDAAYKSKVRKFIFISSNTVYPLTENPVREGDVDFTFFDKYKIVGWMKLFSEKMCEMYSEHKSSYMKTIVVRPGNLYGPYDKFDQLNAKVIPSLIRKFDEKMNPLQVWGDGLDLKDFLYIDDFVDALIRIISTNISVSPINIAAGNSITINDIIDILKKISGQPNTVINYDKSQPSMIPIRRIDNSLAKKILDWQPETPIEIGLLKTFNWYSNFKNTNV